MVLVGKSITTKIPTDSTQLPNTPRNRLVNIGNALELKNDLYNSNVKKPTIQYESKDLIKTCNSGLMLIPLLTSIGGN